MYPSTIELIANDNLHPGDKVCAYLGRAFLQKEANNKTIGISAGFYQIEKICTIIIASIIIPEHLQIVPLTHTKTKDNTKIKSIQTAGIIRVTCHHCNAIVQLDSNLITPDSTCFFCHKLLSHTNTNLITKLDEIIQKLTTLRSKYK